ncbi:hypothetical protein ACLOAV_004491 [Pseudogymnoascus australis]
MAYYGSASNSISGWAMGYQDPTARMDEPRNLSPGIVDRYTDSGMNLMLKKALASVQIQGKLTGQRREQFAKSFSTVVDLLTADFQQQEEQHRRRPAQLPKALLQPRWRPIKSHGPTNQRLMTAREAAEFDLK